MITVLVILVVLLFIITKSVLRGNRPALWVRTGGVVCLAYLLLLAFVGGIYNVPSSSMSPSLKVGDYILALRVGGIADSGDIKRGDVVIFDAPAVPRTMYMKRVLGIPGDVIEYSSDKHFRINGKLTGTLVRQTEDLDEYRDVSERNSISYLYVTDKKIPFLNSRDKWMIPEGYYFMAGDNRDHSWDSRYWENPPGTPKPLRGLVRKASIKARYVTTLFNLSLFKSYDPLETEMRIIRNNDN